MHPCRRAVQLPEFQGTRPRHVHQHSAGRGIQRLWRHPVGLLHGERAHAHGPQNRYLTVGNTLPQRRSAGAGSAQRSDSRPQYRCGAMFGSREGLIPQGPAPWHCLCPQFLRAANCPWREPWGHRAEAPAQCWLRGAAPPTQPPQVPPPRAGTLFCW